MRRTKAVVLAMLVLAGCDRSHDPRAFAVSIKNDLAAAVIVECGVGCRPDVHDEFQLAPGETGQATYPTGTRRDWQLSGGTYGCIHVYFPHYRSHVLLLASDAAPCISRQ